MMAVVKDRPKLKRYVAALQKIRALAESCARQLTGWAGAVDKLSKAAVTFPPVNGNPAKRRNRRGITGSTF